MREFFNADEAAVELQRLTQTSWSAAQVMREAEQGSLPICFQYQGKIGVFRRQESEPVRAIFGNALRTEYLPRGSYLRVQGHPILTAAHQKQDELQARNLELVNLVSGASDFKIASSETLRIMADSGGFIGTAVVMFRVPSSSWLFHTDDLNELASTTRAASTRFRIAPAPLQPQAAATAQGVAESAPAIPMQRSAAQDAAILAAIRSAGHDPQRLPVNETGKSGVKAAIREVLIRDRLFVGVTVFDKAWERLRKQSEIANKADPTPEGYPPS